MSMKIWNKHGSTILVIVSSCLTIGACIFSGKDTLKAKEKVDRERRRKGEDLTTLEKVKVGWKCYWKTALVAGVSIGCTIASDGVNKKAQAAIMSSYMAVKTSYLAYKDKVDEVFGEGSDEKVMQAVITDEIREKYEKNPFDESKDDKTNLYYIEPCGFDNSLSQFVNCTEEEFLTAIIAIIDQFHNSEISVNAMYRIFKQYDPLVNDKMDNGNDIGWGYHTIIDNDCCNIHPITNIDEEFSDIRWVYFVEDADYFREC